MENGVCTRVKKPRKTRKEIKFRNYVFTWFNATEQEIKKFEDYCNEKNYKYVMGDEICPKTGKQHWQGYVSSKIPWAKATLDKLIGGSWCESAGGSLYDNWKYTRKDGKILTNINEIEINLNGRETIIESLEIRMKRNQFFLNKNLEKANGRETMDAMEYGKYMNMKYKWLILTGNKTEMLKQLTKVHRAMNGNLTGILILGDCEDILLDGLYIGMINDINGRLLIWDSDKIPIRYIKF